MTAPRARLRVPLFVRMLALALPIAAVPLAVLGWKTIDVNERELRNSSRQLHLAIVSDVRRAIRGQLSRVQEELTGIGQILLAPGLGDDDHRLALASSKVTGSEDFDAVTVYQLDGKRAGTLKAREAAEPHSRPELDARMLERLGENKLVTGEIVPGGTLELFFAVDIDHQTRGYLGTSMQLGALSKAVSALADEKLNRQGEVYVVDDQRRVVVASDPARQASPNLAAKGVFAAAGGNASFANPFAVTPDYDRDGTAMLGALETLPELGWAAVVERPRALAYASLETVRRTIYLTLLAGAAAAILLAAFFARQLSRPIRVLRGATREIGARRYAPVAPSVTRRGDEIGDLGRAFDHMAGDLDRSEKQLVAETQNRAALSRYLPSDVVDLVLADPSRLKLGGEKRTVTIMFADVCGFTRMSEKMAPEDVVALLNELFTVATEIVQRRGGIIDKFIGDSVMAVWGSPEAHDDDPRRAVDAADDLRRWCETANRKWKQRFGVEVQLAIGINTGDAVAGNVGSEKRLEYTVIGDAVNVAARLEAMAQPGQILISEATRKLIGDGIELRSLGERGLTGRKATTMVFEVAE